MKPQLAKMLIVMLLAFILTAGGTSANGCAPAEDKCCKKTVTGPDGTSTDYWKVATECIPPWQEVGPASMCP